MFHCWKKPEVCCIYQAFSLHFSSPPWDGEHSVLASPTFPHCAPETSKQTLLSWRSKGCHQDASSMHQWGVQGASLPPPPPPVQSSAKEGWGSVTWAPAASPCPQPDVCVVSGELLFTCALLLLTPACCSFSWALLASGPLLRKAEAKNCLLCWVQIVSFHLSDRRQDGTPVDGLRGKEAQRESHIHTLDYTYRII